MKNELCGEIKDLVQVINKMNKKELEEVDGLVNNIIKYKHEDENLMSHVYDRMLSIEFIDEKNLKRTYYKLLKYTKKFNKELADDYEKFFIEKFIEDDEFCL